MNRWESDPILTVEHLSMRFGGLVAIGDLSFAAGRGDITALIGPNGAGKTTVFNCITGFYKPTEGRIALAQTAGTFDGLAAATEHGTRGGHGGGLYLLERMPENEIARHARVARTFQNIRLFGGMTVLENLMVAQHNKLMLASAYTVGGLLGLSAYRTGHVLGNRLLTGLTSLMFGVKLHDMLTGYRVMSRRFVKSFPSAAVGFGIETELTVHAVRLKVPMAEVATHYRERPAGSTSKLSTYRDGARILLTIAGLMRRERPLIFFTSIFAFFALFSLTLGIPVVIAFFQTGRVEQFPTAVLVTGMMMLAFLSLFTGLMLDTVTRGRWEIKRLRYLAIPGPQDLKKP